MIGTIQLGRDSKISQVCCISHCFGRLKEGNVIFLADTTCILALYMFTQIMTHVIGQLAPL